MHGEAVEFDEGFGVDQRFDALASGAFSARMLFLFRGFPSGIERLFAHGL